LNAIGFQQQLEALLHRAILPLWFWTYLPRQPFRVEQSNARLTTAPE